MKGFPQLLGSWWEIFENGDRGSTESRCGCHGHSCSAWGAIFEKKNYIFSRNAQLYKIGMSEKCRISYFSGIKAPQVATRHKGAFQDPKGPRN